ncbi:cell division cycle protein 23 homolog isoform X2 [Babylonia areolata]|uniref:cell division cycle protein 23 homolog isoform X2 n=1 Tax=Babylonia areolata TaxID=304850 RepID=UPI003FD44FF8
MADISSLDLAKVKEELIEAHRECSIRKLLNGAKWAAELSSALEVTVDPQVLMQKVCKEAYFCDVDKVNLATTYFDLKEYDRAAHVVRDLTRPLPYFLHMYAQYLAEETRRLDNTSDSIGQVSQDNSRLRNMKTELSTKHQQRELDGFGLYLYGVVLKKLDLSKMAVDVLVEAVTKQPLHWGAWQELASLITDREMLLSLPLPDHWVKWLFLAHVYLELQLHEEALDIYHSFINAGFHKATYLLAQVATTFHNMRDVEQAVGAFGELEKMDPFRLENMDVYSNLLYVKEMRAELAYLAHRCCDINKYRVETCCVIGNYYSLRCQHEKAILYFQRALRLNPHYLSAWTLMGHEYMEMKNTPAAIQAYRQAIEVNKRDYRAWYGLGQTYEILKMPFYSLYYYRQAHVLKPNDSRMVVALGECYEKLERLQEAKKCYRKAHSIGDVEGGALYKLAKLYERLSENEQAASAYTEYILDAERRGVHTHDEISQAYRYLANFHWSRRQLDEAYAAAQKCAEYAETREDAKVILQQIQSLRSQGEGSTPARLDDSMGSLTSGDHFRPGEPRAFGRVTPVNLKFTP